MKRKIEDYINQKVAIECETKEQWQKIIDFSKIELINKFDLSSNKCINLNTIAGGYWGRSSKEDIIKQGYTIYPASDFLEEEPKFEIDKWYYVELGEYKHYLKFRKINKDIAFIDKNGYINNLNEWTYGESINIKKVTFYKLLIDLSEIQQYLPLFHIDTEKYLP